MLTRADITKTLRKVVYKTILLLGPLLLGPVYCLRFYIVYPEYVRMPRYANTSPEPDQKFMRILGHFMQNVQPCLDWSK